MFELKHGGSRSLQVAVFWGTTGGNVCDEYRRLFAAYQKATAEHAKAVTALAEHRSVTHESLSQRCEKARLASKEARDKVDAHVFEHGCVGRTSAAAQANQR